MIIILLLHKLFPLKSSWTDVDIYPGDKAPKVSKTGEFTEGSTYFPASTKSKVYLKECLFTSFTNRAIYFIPSSSSCKTLIELSTFNSCTSSSGSGGCIYYKNGNFVMNKCCSVKCYTHSGTGQFGCIHVSSENTNNVLDSSIALSYGDSASEEAALWIKEGTIIIKTLNVSKNKCLYNTAMICRPSTTETCSISFSSINGNEGTDSSYGRIIVLFTSRKIIEMTYSNIIDNIMQTKCSSAMITASGPYADGIAQIKHCCIINEKVPKLFDTISGGMIEVINCTIDPNFITKISGSVTTNGESWKPISSFINPIKCTEDEGYCKASYDAVGTLTPNVDVDPPVSGDSDNSGFTHNFKNYITIRSSRYLKIFLFSASFLLIKI